MDDDKRKDFIEHGSAAHAQMLGLRKATDDDKLKYQGYALVDVTAWGPLAREDYIQAQLIQRVHELQSQPTVSKSAPSLWTPIPG